MDRESGLVPRVSTQGEGASRSLHQEDTLENDQEDPLVLSTPWIALLGLAIGIASVGVPLAAVFTDRPLGGESMVPTVLESDGSKPSSPLPFARPSESGR